MTSTETHLSGPDRVGLGLLALFLFSPVMFKIQVSQGVAIHPCAPLLAAAWGWIAWMIGRTQVTRSEKMWLIERQAWNIPMILSFLVIGGLALSLAINGLRLGSFSSAGWLLLFKWALYLAPLPLAALLVMRTGRRVLQLAAWLIPAVAFLTLLYTAARFLQAAGGEYFNAYFDGKAMFLAMGMMGEVLSAEGLTVRSDTVSHGAYGMYLVLVLAFSSSLAWLRGWNGILPASYAVAQGIILGPFLVLGVLLTGSRSSLVLLAGMLLMFLTLLIANPGHAQPPQRRIAAAALVLTVSACLFFLPRWFGPIFPTLERMHQTVDQPLELQATLLGRQTPDFDPGTQANVAVRNAQSRVWLWGQTFRYMTEHPLTLITGIGYDRRRFVEQVVGLPYVGTNIELRTAHNLYLDVAIKGGIAPFVSLVLLCLWLLWTAWTSVWITTSAGPGAELYGAGWVILTLWPPLLLVSGLGEDLVTDNLLLHWTTLFGLVLGLRGAILRSAMAGRIVHLSATAGLGGGPAYITAVARHQVHHATEVRVVCSDEKPYVDIWREMGVRVTVLPMRRPNARTIWTIVGLMLRDPAPVHAHGRGAAFFAFWIKMCVRVPVVYTPHGPHYAYMRGWRFVPAWCGEYLFRIVFDAVLYVSSGERDLAESLRLPMRSSRVVLSGMISDPGHELEQPARREAVRREVGVAPSQFVIGWIGRFHHQKGLDIFLASIPEVAARVPDAVWLVIGEGEPGAVERHRETMRRLGLGEKVTFLGGRPDADQVAGVCDLYISTSRWEGLPLVLLEVMARDVPIVASDVVGNGDVLDGWGVLFPPNDAAAAAEAQVALATDPMKRQALARRGRAVLHGRFLLTRMLRDLDHVYRDVWGSEVLS